MLHTYKIYFCFAWFLILNGTLRKFKRNMRVKQSLYAYVKSELKERDQCTLMCCAFSWAESPEGESYWLDKSIHWSIIGAKYKL